MGNGTRLRPGVPLAQLGVPTGAEDSTSRGPQCPRLPRGHLPHNPRPMA